MLIDGIKVEVQGTEPFAPGDLEGLTDDQILYVGAHRQALEAATAVTLAAEADGARATVPMATPGALFAMKLHAIEDRRAGGGVDKRAGDAWDLYRILLDLDRAGAVRAELRTFSAHLRQAIAGSAERVLIERSARTISWMKAGDERMAAITAHELEALAAPVVATLSST